MPLLIAGTHSGCGKSTVTLGVLSALGRLGRKVQAFKAGPDFIDPGLHGLATGRPSRNLDLWMCGEDYVNDCLRRYSAGADAVVVEGAMGLYDGGKRSTAALARVIGAKVVLVVDAYGMAESAGAVLKGFGEYGLPLDAVIFNRAGSESHYERLRAAADGVEPLGYVPRDVTFGIPERHLGLLVAEESPFKEGSLDALAGAVMEHVNIERVFELSRETGGSPVSCIEKPGPDLPDLRVAVARDRAFCFYYEDNLDMLSEAGAELIPFSPLSDRAVPEGADALYIGGGYPEMHAAGLSENMEMAESIREFAECGSPVYAECGGLMYLGEGLYDADGTFYPMAGVLPFKSAMLKKRAALGYREVRMGRDCVLGREGETLRGHEFHYSEVSQKGDKEGVSYNVLGEEGGRVCSALYRATLASYTHVHFGSRPGAARHFIEFIKDGRWKE